MKSSVTDLGNMALGRSRAAAEAFSHVQSADAVRPRQIYAVPVQADFNGPVRLAEALYRGCEILLAAMALVCSVPIMLILAAIVRLDSPGPVLFRHRRPAQSKVVRGYDLADRQDVRPPPGGYAPDKLYYVPAYFTLLKFRTMHHDARQRFPELYAHQYPPAQFRSQNHTFPDDPRVTRAGRTLRRLSVDELPNLWSVVVGDMRLVGPRPEAPEVLQYYTPEEMYKFACKPGITGLAQINGRGLLTWGETLDWDLEYVRTRSVGLDIKIIIRTLHHVITRHGAF